MNKFILLKARNQELYEKAKTALRKGALDLLTYNPSRIRVREFKESFVIFANFELATTGGLEKHHVYTGDSETFAFDGFPYSTSVHASSNWAEQLGGLWRQDEWMLENIFGTWALAKFDAFTGARVLSDFSGMTPVFYWSDRDYLAVSPRQMLLSGICGTLEHDLESMAWLSGQANLMGDRTSWKNIRHLPPQWTMTFSSDPSDLTYSLYQREVWSDRVDPQPDEDKIREIGGSMLEQCDALGRLPLPPLRLDITGGLDSRLVAALATASSLGQNIECMQTSGVENSHEIQIGRAIADLVGISHEARVPGKYQVSPQGILDDIRRSMFRYEASICPSDGTTGASPRSRVVMTGSAGEIYRRHCKPHMKVVVKTREELISLFADYHQKTDPLSVEKAELADSQRSTLQSIAMGFHDAGVELNDVTDIFFMRFRLPLWNGVMMNNIFNATRVYPLVNYQAAKYAFSRGYLARVRDKLHFEIMLQINPSLCAFPFLGFTWPEEYRNYAASRGVTLADAPFPVEGSASLSQSSNNLSVMSTVGWDEARAYLLDSSSSRLWEIIDRARLEAVFERGPGSIKGVVGMKQIFSLLGMQAVLNDDIVRQPDGDLNQAPTLDGATAKEIFGQ